mmetsp:Transcript_58272/g.92218  ORF Transcript_58272/g.92218 Transcript_58272/m.92218 type:complete len:200 (-) Transcript_58272:530-1129(-)
MTDLHHLHCSPSPIGLPSAVGLHAWAPPLLGSPQPLRSRYHPRQPPLPAAAQISRPRYLWILGPSLELPQLLPLIRHHAAVPRRAASLPQGAGNAWPLQWRRAGHWHRYFGLLATADAPWLLELLLGRPFAQAPTPSLPHPFPWLFAMPLLRTPNPACQLACSSAVGSHRWPPANGPRLGLAPAALLVSCWRRSGGSRP